MTPAYFLQHHEVVQIPVQNAGPLQLRKLVQLQPQRTAAEVECAGVGYQLLQCRALERDGKAAAQTVQVQMQPVRRAHHGQASQGAFAGFGLEDGAHSGSGGGAGETLHPFKARMCLRQRYWHMRLTE